MQPKKISHPCGCCEFACGWIIRWGKRPWADTNIKVPLVISRYKASQYCGIVSGLLTEKSDLRSCFCVLTMRHRRGLCEVVKQWAYFKSARRLRRRHPTCFFLQFLDPNDLTGDRLIRSLPRSFELIRRLPPLNTWDRAWYSRLDNLLSPVELATNTTVTILLRPLTA